MSIRTTQRQGKVGGMEQTGWDRNERQDRKHDEDHEKTFKTKPSAMTWRTKTTGTHMRLFHVILFNSLYHIVA